MEELYALAASLLGMESADDQLKLLCQGARESLLMRLREGVTEEDCGSAFLIAAAALAASAQSGTSGFTSFTAGPVSLENASSSGTLPLYTAALELLKPWMQEDGFAFLGVRG